MKENFMYLYNLLLNNKIISGFISYKKQLDKKTDLFFYGIINNNVILKYCKNKQKLKIDKKFKANVITDIKITPTINSNSDSMNGINKYAKEVCKCLFIFESESKNHNFDLNIFYHNLKTLKVNKSNMVDIILNKLFNRVGWYSVANNKINYNENNDSMHIIFHEILHMATGIKDKANNISFCGFSQKTKDKAIGDGLNEGYTELLTQRFFDDKSATYLIETAVARMCQEIIGQEKMTQLYFKADLKGLIDEFSKYVDRKEVLDFLINLDFLSKYKEKKDNILAIKENLNNVARLVYEFLIKTYKSKLNLSEMKSWGGEEFIVKCFTEEYTNALDSYKIQMENSELEKSSSKDKLDKKQQLEAIKNELLNQNSVVEEKSTKTK